MVGVLRCLWQGGALVWQALTAQKSAHWLPVTTSVRTMTAISLAANLDIDFTSSLHSTCQSEIRCE
jgi:hypothetical protein